MVIICWKNLRKQKYKSLVIGPNVHFLIHQAPFIFIQSNLVIGNFLVTLKLFLNAKCSLSLWSKLKIGHRKLFLNTNLFLIKTFLFTKFDCTTLYISNYFCQNLCISLHLSVCTTRCSNTFFSHSQHSMYILS